MALALRAVLSRPGGSGRRFGLGARFLPPGRGPVPLCLLVCAACGSPGTEPPVSPSAEAGRATLYERAPMMLDLTLALSDPRTATECPQESFVWPGCDPPAPAGYSNLYVVGDPLVYGFGPAGVYDLEIATRNEDGTPGPAVRRQAVPIGETATTLEIALDSDRILRFSLQADPPGRPDGDICALGRATGDGGSSTDPRVTCRVEAPDGRTFEATSFHREYLYWSLMTDLCQAGIHLQESDYAGRFRCDEPAVP